MTNHTHSPFISAFGPSLPPSEPVSRYPILLWTPSSTTKNLASCLLSLPLIMFPGLAYQHLHREKHTPKLPPELASRPGIASMPFLESPNARSRTITVADGPNTGGVCLIVLWFYVQELTNPPPPSLAIMMPIPSSRLCLRAYSISPPSVSTPFITATNKRFLFLKNCYIRFSPTMDLATI